MLLQLLLCTMHAVASQTVVAKWIFSTGYDVLKNTAEAARTLGVDADFASQLDALKAQLTPYKIGKYGQIQEWQEDCVSTSTIAASW